MEIYRETWRPRLNLPTTLPRSARACDQKATAWLYTNTVAYSWQQVCKRRDGKGKMTNVMKRSRGAKHKVHRIDDCQGRPLKLYDFVVAFEVAGSAGDSITADSAKAVQRSINHNSGSRILRPSNPAKATTRG